MTGAQKTVAAIRLRFLISPTSPTSSGRRAGTRRRSEKAIRAYLLHRTVQLLEQPAPPRGYDRRVCRSADRRYRFDDLGVLRMARAYGRGRRWVRGHKDDINQECLNEIRPHPPRPVMIRAELDTVTDVARAGRGAHRPGLRRCQDIRDVSGPSSPLTDRSTYPRYGAGPRSASTPRISAAGRA